MQGVDLPCRCDEQGIWSPQNNEHLGAGAAVFLSEQGAVELAGHPRLGF